MKFLELLTMRVLFIVLSKPADKILGRLTVRLEEYKTAKNYKIKVWMKIDMFKLALCKMIVSFYLNVLGVGCYV